MKYIDTNSSIIQEKKENIIPIEVEESVTKCDDVKEFVNKCVIRLEMIGKNIHVPFRDVYNSYIKFCESQKYIPSITDRKFKLEMSKYNIKTLKNNGTTFINIKLNN
jgi:DNA replicative helicase MCM subunit Mcm2 (Cdc46/Mcm family)